MLLPPLIISLLWIVVAQARRGDTPDAAEQAPLVPSTAAGRLALASLSLMVVVILAGAFLAITVPVGVVMLGLATFARWGRGDRSTLLALPLVFGVWLVVVPSVIEVWSALHED
ncbi:MAG TPA: hypothetical protein VFH02_11505 [Jiangellaceae bacterium]|nr:hypothetical protein [Jiangellaceae bacterium]